MGVASFAILRDRRTFINWVFAIAMGILALETLFTGVSTQAVFAEQAIFWKHLSLTAAAFVPGIWLLYGLSFTQENLRLPHTGWKWVVLAVFMIHLVFVILLRETIFEGAPIEMPDGWSFKLGWAGYSFYLSFLLSLVLIMMILERILVTSKGRKRWKVKFFVFGIGGLFAIRIYTITHNMVFHTLMAELEIINACALLIANFLILISMFRTGVQKIDIYFSHKMLYNSLTLIFVGLYFLSVGISARIFDQFLSLPLKVLIIFITLLGLFIILFSDRLRLGMKQFVSRHLRRPQYDYRKVWTDFTAHTTALMEDKALCAAVAKMIAEMFDTLSVSIWLSIDKQSDMVCAASTTLTTKKVRSIAKLQNDAPEIMQLFKSQDNMLDLDDPKTVGTVDLKPAQADVLRRVRIRYVVPLKAAGEFIGFISLADRVNGQPFLFEEVEMLRTIADQAAISLFNVKLSKRMHIAKEMEAFQTVATFFVHDLKNLAAKLSLMLKNLPVHFDNPDFRNDAMRLMSQSVDEVDSLCSSLSSLREKIEIRPVQTDLNSVVAAALTDGNGLSVGCLANNLQPIPKVYADPGQIRKVLDNLIINAGDAVGNDGEILVATGTRDGWVEIAVRDTGCGISKEFMDQCLFRPFKTTKKQGTGIGLFQCKQIVEAHNGIIEVESQQGQGSTFRVLLPAIND
jgi:putative PEP-CTERM system histidine kinase